MSHTPHTLKDDFADYADAISRLTRTDAHFAQLAEQYHGLNRQVHRAETLVEPMEELTEMQLRKERAALKDQLWAMISRAAAPASPE